MSWKPWAACPSDGAQALSDINSVLFGQYYGQAYAYRPVANAVAASAIACNGPVATGTATARALSAATYLSKRPRIGFVSAAAAGSIGGVRILTSPGTAGFSPSSGFNSMLTHGIPSMSANSRWFSGHVGGVGALANVDPSSLIDMVGIGASIGSGNVNLFWNDGAGAASSLDLGSSFPNVQNAVYQLLISIPVGGAYVSYTVTRLDSAGKTSGTLSSDIPTASVYGHAQQWISNNTDAASVAMDTLNWEAMIPY